MELAELGPALAARGTRSVVIVPSRAIDKWHEPPAHTQALEERLLCELLALRDPGLRLVYVTSSPVAPATVDYFLSLLPAAVRRSARERLTLLSARDASPRPLAEKLLERPRLLTRICWALRGPSHLAPYMSTDHERALADALGLPLYAADPGAARFGTKSGSRELFARAGVPHPLGIERVRDPVAAIAALRAREPRLRQVVIKLEAGAAGDGNALADLRRDGSIARLVPEAGVSAEAFLAKLARGGGIVEERITDDDLRSPSVQLELTPAGEVVIVSTHDQVLDGQRFVGCRFPAAPDHAPAITALARRVGRELVSAGVVGRCAIDFVTAAGRAYAIEVNLRKGGTTHPYAALQHLTGGTYDAARATFTAADGTPRCYVASDHVEATSRVPLRCSGGRGVVLHMLSALGSLGCVGLTAIGDSAADAQRRFDEASALLREPAAVAA
jgi:ATP-grasp domain/Pre ATP-grasp domain